MYYHAFVCVQSLKQQHFQNSQSNRKRMIENRLVLDNFLLECNTILGELDNYYATKKRLIEHCFQKLLDNVPKEIKDVPINQCLKEYMESLETNKRDNNNAPVEHSLCESEDLLPAGSVENLTSTVKKAKGSKTINFKEKMDNMLHGHSIIREAVSDVDGEAAAENEEADEAKDKTIKEAEDYKLKIIYFMKDLSKVTASLSDLNNVNLKNVHENSLSDLKKIAKILNK